MKRKKLFMLILGCITLFFIAVLYIWSVFISPLEQEFGWDCFETSGIFTLSICTFCVGSILAGLLFMRFKSSGLLRIGAICLFCGFGLAAAGNTLILLYIGYGGFCGLGIGICYNTILTCCNSWFADKRGLCNGILLMVYGFGAMIMSVVAERLIQLFKWRLVFWTFGIIETFILIIASFFLIPYSDRTYSKREETSSTNDVSTLHMLKTSSFYKAFLWLVIISSCGLVTVGNAAPIALEIGIKPALASVLTGFVSAVGGFGRLMFGRIYDLNGRKKTMIFDTICCIFALFFIICALCYKAIPLLFIGFLFLGLGFGGMASISTIIVRDLYGLHYYSKNLSIMGLQLIPASLLGPLLSAAIYSMTGSYIEMFVVLLILCLIAIYLPYSIKRKTSNV